MNKKSLITGSLSLFLMLWILISCNPKPEPNKNLNEDARKYASLKCEMRLKLEHLQSDTVLSLTEAEVDSIRKVMSAELNKIRSAYEADTTLLNQFKTAVIQEQGKLDECRELQMQLKPGEMKKSGQEPSGD